MKLKNVYLMKYTLIKKAVLVVFILLAAVSGASAKNRKYGLFVGINQYSGGINPLKGCVNDATKMREAMIGKFGFKAADTTLLTDAQATREGILNNLKKYQVLAGVGDILVFHYSGHGTLFPDAYSEEQDETKMVYMEAPNDEGVMEVIYERDKYDSAIVPVDARSRTSGKPWRNLILDDELYAIFSAVTRKGAQVVLISDSCHSGSVDRQKRTGVLPRAESLATIFGVRKFSELDLKKPKMTRSTRTLPPAKGLYLAMTGSKDDEFSLDATIGGVPMGLFTSMLLANMPTTVNARRPVSYEALMNTVSPAVARQARDWDNNQNPQLNIEYGNPKMAIFSVPLARQLEITRPPRATLPTSTPSRSTYIPQLGKFEKKTTSLRNLATELFRNERWNEARVALEIAKEEEYRDYLGHPPKKPGGNSTQSTVKSDSPQFQNVSFSPSSGCEKDYPDLRDDLSSLAATAAQIARKSRLSEADESELLQIRTQLDCAGAEYQKALLKLFEASADSEEKVAKFHRIPRLRALMSDLRQVSDSGPAALLYTFVTENEYWVFLVSADLILAKSHSIDAGSLRTRIEDFRRTLQNSKIDPLPLAQDLYTELFEPVAADVEKLGIKTIVWSLDKELRYLPVAALHDGKQYLVQKYAQAIYTPAAASRWKDTATTTAAAGFGLSEGTPPLPFVLQELNSIFGTGSARNKAILPGPVYSNQAFSIDSIRKEVARATSTGLRSLHIASHFTLVPGEDSRDKSYLSLGGNRRFTIADLDSSFNFFAGVHLLVLSACNTAVVDQKSQKIGSGAEVESFGVLAQDQGAVSVMATLWPVNDPATSMIMPEFYRNWTAKTPSSKAVSLQNAQIAMIDGRIRSDGKSGGCRADAFADAAKQDQFRCDPKAPFSHPFYWSPFVLIGNWR